MGGEGLRRRRSGRVLGTLWWGRGGDAAAEGAACAAHAELILRGSGGYLGVAGPGTGGRAGSPGREYSRHAPGVCRDARHSFQLWAQSSQGRPPPISARGSESTRTPGPLPPISTPGALGTQGPQDTQTRHFSARRLPGPDQRGLPPLHLSAGQSPQGRPPHLISARGASPAQISRDPHSST